MDTGWNHKIRYHDLILRAVPSPCDCALDAGCGQGLLTRQLATRAKTVVGIDLDLPSTPSAQANTTFVQGDIMTHSFPPASFDFIAAVATLHHLPLHPASPASEISSPPEASSPSSASTAPPPSPTTPSPPPPSLSAASSTASTAPPRSRPAYTPPPKPSKTSEPPPPSSSPPQPYAAISSTATPSSGASPSTS